MTAGTVVTRSPGTPGTGRSPTASIVARTPIGHDHPGLRAPAHFTFDSSRPQHGEMLQRLCKTRGVLTVRIATAIQ